MNSENAEEVGKFLKMLHRQIAQCLKTGEASEIKLENQKGDLVVIQIYQDKSDMKKVGTLFEEGSMDSKDFLN